MDRFYHIDDPMKWYYYDGLGMHKERDGSWSTVIHYQSIDTAQVYTTYPDRWEERFKRVGQA